jgi:hypothetical protein
MFVKIDPTLGSNTDPRNRIYNIMRAVKAVATANAGTTPTCNVISGPTGTFEANQMITLIDNTEAGGWLVDASNTACGNIGDTYNASLSNTYLLNLYNDSGKATYPYKVFGLRTNPSYPFGSNFVNYPIMTVYYGCSNTYVWGQGSYSASAYSSANYTYHRSLTTTMLFDLNNSWTQIGNTTTGSPVQSTSYYITPLHYTHGQFYMAATSDYLIFTQANSYLLYCGTRETQAWEDSFSDNPPVVGFFYQRLNQPQGVCSMHRFLNVANTSSNGAALYDHKIIDFTTNQSSYTNNTANPHHTITGDMRAGSSPQYQWNTRQTARMNGYTASPLYNAPMFYGTGHAYWHQINNYYAGNWNQGGAPYSPVYDSATQTMVPPAIPITLAYYGYYYTPGGRLKGILKSLSGTNTFISQYASTDQDFNITISGNTEPYRIVPVAPTGTGASNTSTSWLDTFLIRKK